MTGFAGGAAYQGSKAVLRFWQERLAAGKGNRTQQTVTDVPQQVNEE